MRVFKRFHRVSVPDLLERHDHPHDRVGDLDPASLLTWTNPRPGSKRQVGPEPVPGFLPALGPELFGVFAPEVLSALQGVEADCDFVALLDRDGGLALRAASGREHGVFEGDALVGADARVETERLADYALEVLERLELSGGWIGRATSQDLAAEFGKDVGVAGEEEEDVCERDGDGVVGWEEDVEQLFADGDSINVFFGQFVRQNVVSVALRLGSGAMPQTPTDYPVHECVRHSARLPESFVAGESVPKRQHHPFPHPALCVIVSVKERLSVRRRVRCQRLDRLAEKELGCGIEREALEEGLEIDRGLVSGYHVQQSLYMDIECR